MCYFVCVEPNENRPPNKRRQALFLGTHEIKLDSKNRISVPAEIRRAIDIERDGESFIFTVGINGKAWLYCEKEYLAMASQHESDEIPSEEDLAYEQSWYGTAFRRVLDEENRLILPDKILRRTKLGKDLALIGVKGHLEIWNRVEWEAREDELAAKRVEMYMARKAKLEAARELPSPADRTGQQVETAK